MHATATVDRSVEALAEEAERRADEFDAGNQLPPALYADAAGLGLFRQLVPVELGGRGDSPLAWFRQGLALAEHEPALAWVVTQGAAELGWIAAGGDPAWAAHVLADPLAASASTIAGLGTLRVEGGTATLAGSWSFDTGCQGATWVGGLALAEGDGAAGPPLRICWVPAERATIVEDWDAIGLRGTGSHGITIAAQSVPLAWTVAVFDPTPNDRGPYRCLVGNGNWPIAGAVAATQLGNARRALDEVRRIVVAKAPAPAFTPLAEHGAVQRRLGELEGAWMAAVASVERELEALWDEACTHQELSAEQRWRMSIAHATANRIAVEVVDGACELAGTTVTSRRHKLSRCLLDAHALRGHIATNGAVLERATRVALGVTAPDPYI